MSLRRIRWDLALLFGAAAGAAAATLPVSDGDTFWHLATARATLMQGLVRQDLFSWTVPGAAVPVTGWLGEIALYGAYIVGDWRGIVLLRAAEVAALVALVFANSTLASPRPLAAVLATVPGVVLGTVVWRDRPELMGIVLFAALLVLLRLGRAGRRGALVVAIALIAVWANVDTSFALGVALTIAVCADGALRDASHRSRYLVIALAALAVTLATPAGIGAWAGQGTTPLRQVSEWGVIDVRTPVGFVYATTLALVLASAILGRRGDASEVIVLVPVTLVSLTALRQAPLLAIAGAPLLAVRAEWVLNEIQGRWGTRGDPRPAGDALPSRRPTRSDGPARTIGVVGAVLLAAAAVFVTPTTLDEGAYPVAALASLPQGAGLLARYEWGGWLIWRAPATPVFVDGRLTPYVGGVLDDYRAILDARPGWQEVIARRGVRSLLVAPSDAVAVRARELRWTVVSSSASYVLLTVP